MTVCLRQRNGKEVEVKVCCTCYTLPLLLMYHYLYAEDMFGADDADWAIYRKIVRVRRPPLSVILLLTSFLSCLSRIQQHLRPMKKRTWRSCRSSNRNCWHTTPILRINTRTHQSQASVLLSCQHLGLRIRKGISQVCLYLHFLKKMKSIYFSLCPL